MVQGMRAEEEAHSTNGILSVSQVKLFGLTVSGGAGRRHTSMHNWRGTTHKGATPETAAAPRVQLECCCRRCAASQTSAASAAPGWRCRRGEQQNHTSAQARSPGHRTAAVASRALPRPASARALCRRYCKKQGPRNKGLHLVPQASAGAGVHCCCSQAPAQQAGALRVRSTQCQQAARSAAAASRPLTAAAQASH